MLNFNYLLGDKMKRKKNMTVKDEQRQFKQTVINFVDYEDDDYLFIDTSSGS